MIKSPLLRLLTGVVAVALVLAGLVIATTRSSKPDAPAEKETVHTVTGAHDGRQAATLEVVTGAESVIIHSEPMDGFLYRASTLPGSRVEPAAAVDGEVVRLSLNGTEVAGQATVHVYLNSTVRWTLKLAGGGLRQVVDFGSGRLAAVDVVAGVQELDVTVPKPEGELPIRVGGVGKLLVHAPAGPPAQLTLGQTSTVGKATLDTSAKQNLAGGAVIALPGWQQAADRYALHVDGGAAEVLLDRR
ncbi:hypothetical protein [Dactylosporangium sp. NPDC006015]|uniref:hypothetical protein n=1 Tax=Dactylosporangium sp. NPDC006015 TaxID=3154576 RepID=UPI0033ACDE63